MVSSVSPPMLRKNEQPLNPARVRVFMLVIPERSGSGWLEYLSMFRDSRPVSPVMAL